MSKMVKDTVHLEALNVFLNASFFGCQFFMSVARRKTVVQLGSFEGTANLPPLGSRGKAIENFGKFAF